MDYVLSRSHRSTGEDEHLAWQLLSLIAEENRLELQRHLRRAMGQWSRAGRLTPALTKAVCSHTEDREHLKVQAAMGQAGKGPQGCLLTQERKLKVGLGSSKTWTPNLYPKIMLVQACMYAPV